MKNVLILTLALFGGLFYLSAEPEAVEAPVDVQVSAEAVLDKVVELSDQAAQVELTQEQQDIVDKFIPELVQNVFSLIGLFALLAAILPQGSKSGTVIAFLRSLLDAFAGNWLNAKNHRK